MFNFLKKGRSCYDIRILQYICKILFGIIITFILYQSGYFLLWVSELFGMDINSIVELINNSKYPRIGIILFGVVGQLWLFFFFGYFLPMLFHKLNKQTYTITVSLLISIILCLFHYLTMQNMYNYYTQSINITFVLYITLILGSIIGSTLGYVIGKKYNNLIVRC